MDQKGANDSWEMGNAYEPFMGRWSKLVARLFLEWLDRAAWQRWLDAGCGTGALTGVVLASQNPISVTGIDPSVAFVRHASETLSDPRAKFAVASADELQFGDAEFDCVVSGLVLNFLPDVAQAMKEMRRVTRPGGIVAAYVWDYAGEMQMLRQFWDVAVRLHPAICQLDEGTRFPICQPEPLAALFVDSGLREVEARSIVIPTDFQDFDDFWQPFLGGQGPAPSFAMSLSHEERDTLREEIRRALPISADGSIHLTARAWGLRGSV